MSKILTNLTLFHTKLIVNTYTAITLPFYAIYQKPWQRLKLADMVLTKSLKKSDRIIWSRKFPAEKKLPCFQCSTYIEAFEKMDRNRLSIGIRDILDEKIELDDEGLPLAIDGRVIKKVVLADNYRWITVAEVMDKVNNIAKALSDMGIKKGDKIIIYADAQANWFLCSLAIGKMNAIVVTLFPNLGTSGVIYGMNQTNAKVVITSEELKNKILTFIDKIPNIENIIYFPSPSKLNNSADVTKCPDHLKIKSFDELLKLGSKLPPKNFPLPSPDDLALIMYTSGTTSLPKAVMITHRTLMANVKNMTTAAEDMNFQLQDMSLASFLPLSHIFGFVFNIFMFINGSKIGFCSPFTILNSSPAHVPGQLGDFRLINPSVIVVVPLVLERIQKEIYAKLNQRGSLAAPLFTYFMDYKNRWFQRGFQTPIIDYFICNKIRQEFGSNLSYIGIGGAALHSSIQAFTRSCLNVTLLNAYGCTETCGGVYICDKYDVSLGICGIPIDDVKAQLVDWPEGGYLTTDVPNQRGELLIGGDTVASGYYEMPEETKESFYTDEEGTRWFYTGDIGEIDPKHGRLRIIDRKKDLSKLANGEYVSLGKIETSLRSSRYVENICICTDMYSNDLVALITPNRKIVKELAKTINKGHFSHKERCEDEEITTIVHASIKDSGLKAGLKAKEIPARIRMVEDVWSPDNNLLTAAMKLKRQNVYKYYHQIIKEMYDSIKADQKMGKLK